MILKAQFLFRLRCLPTDESAQHWHREGKIFMTILVDQALAGQGHQHLTDMAAAERFL